MATLVFALLPGAPAPAVQNTGVFQLNGKILPDGSATYAWGNLFGASGQSLVAPNTTLLATTFLNDTALPDPSYFSSNGAGVKDIDSISNWGCTTQNNPTAKDNLLNAYAAFVQVPKTAPDNAGDLVLYLGSERQSSNGTAFAGFWLFKGPVSCNQATGTFTGTHTNGDLLIVSDYTNGGSTQDVSLFQWSGGATGTLVPVTNGTGGVCGTTPTDNMCAIANSATIKSPWPPGSAAAGLAANTFVEAGIDLTAELGGNVPCFTFFQAETRSSNQLSATLKDFAGGTFANCAPPGVTTQLMNAANNSATSSVVVGSSVYDTAQLVNAVGIPKGTLTYSLFTNSTCTTAATNPTFSGGTNSATVTLNADGTVPSSPALTFTQSGAPPPTYYWQASYSGDTTIGGRNLAAKSVCNTEPLTVTPAPSNVVTTPSTVTLVVGTGTFADTAAVSGGYFPAAGPSPAGTVTFKLYGPFASAAAITATSCVDTGAGSNLLATSANVGASASPAPTQTSASYTSASYTPTQTGTYQWVASYAGNVNSQASVSGCGTGGEQVTINPASPAIGTVPSTTSTVVVGTGTFFDTANVTGGYFPGVGTSPAGTVTFKLYGPFASAGAITATSCVDSGAGANLVLGPTTVSSTVSGPTSASYNSPTFTPTQTGVYQWVAAYNGNPNNNPVAASCNNTAEEVTVGPALSGMVTTPSTSSLTVGGSFTDTAAVSGGYFPAAGPSPAGTVTFKLYGPFPSAAAITSTSCVDSGAGANLLATSANVGASATPAPTQTSAAYQSQPYTATQSGVYQWVASYAGNSNTLPSNGACGTGGEQVTVNPGSPGISSMPSTASSSGTVLVGTGMFSDTATVMGGFFPAAGPSPAGTVTFTLYGPFAAGTAVSCSTANLLLTSAPITASATPTQTLASYASPSFTPTQTGIYQWVAAYSGNSNNNPVAGSCPDSTEQVTVGPASPSITTAPPQTTIVIGNGATISDTASVLGGYFPAAGTSPAGTVTFKLYGPFTGGAAATCVDSGAGANLLLTSIPEVALATPAPTQTSAGYASNQYTPTVAGLYQWVATYNGNSNNNMAATGCGDTTEQVTVQPATPAIASTISLSDTVHVSPVSGAGTPTGRVTFALFGPSGSQTPPDCTGMPIAGSVETVDPLPASGTATTPSPVLVGTPGIYAWQVTYTSTSGNYTNTSTSCTAELATIAYQAPSPIS